MEGEARGGSVHGGGRERGEGGGRGGGSGGDHCLAYGVRRQVEAERLVGMPIPWVHHAIVD